jgi:Sec-independent protein translocase protein TatA
MARSIGRGLREVRKAQDEVRKTIQVDLDDEPPPPRTRSAPASSTPADAPGPAEGAETPEGERSPGAAAGATTAGAATSSVKDVSRTLGRGLAELRKAREEIQRTFRVDLDDANTASPRRPPSPRPAGEGGAPRPEVAAGPAEEVVPGPQTPPAD